MTQCVRYDARMAYVRLVTVTLCVAIAAGRAQAPDPIDRITEADLKADLFTLAGDAMRGREGGTLDEMAASVWVAERARLAGLQPAGDNGTYFQLFPLERFRVSASSPVSLGGKALRMGRDVIPDNTVLADVDAPVIRADANALANVDMKGKTLVVSYDPAPAAGATAGVAAMPNQSAPNAPPALRTWLRNIQRTVTPQNPAAIVAIVPDEFRDQWDRTAITFPRGTYGLDPDGTADQRIAPRGEIGRAHV